jgi:hypothetical protein
MVIREDADTGSIVVGDIHKKSKYARQRITKALAILSSVRQSQLSVLYCGLGLQEAIDETADDVGVARTLLGEFLESVPRCRREAAKGFVAEVQDAIKLEGLDYIDPPPENDTDAPDSSTTNDGDVAQKDVPPTPLVTISSPAPLSPDGDIVHGTSFPYNDTILYVRVEHFENLHGMFAYHTLPCDWAVTLGPFGVR